MRKKLTDFFSLNPLTASLQQLNSHPSTMQTPSFLSTKENLSLRKAQLSIKFCPETNNTGNNQYNTGNNSTEILTSNLLMDILL